MAIPILIAFSLLVTCARSMEFNPVQFSKFPSLIAMSLLVTYARSQLELIPVQYSLPFPWQIDLGNSEYWSKFDMCPHPPYQNCYTRVRVTLPHVAWDIPSGQYINLYVYSSNGDQCTLIAQNNIASQSPQIADFLYLPQDGSIFYVRLENDVDTGLQGTLDVQIDCDGASERVPKIGRVNKRSVIPCGKASTIMSMEYRPVKPLVFKTAQNFNDWLQLKIPICMSERYQGLRYTAQASDTQSAVSSRACSFTPCTAAADIAVDRSGSGLNSFNIPNFNNKTLYMGLEGWGQYQQLNSFTITLQAILDDKLAPILDSIV